MLKPHNHDAYIRRFEFKDGANKGVVWESCTARLDGVQCSYAKGDGRSPATVCKRHTFVDPEVLPEIDDVIAPEIDQETIDEISVEGWVATATPELVEHEDAEGEDEEQDDEEQNEEGSDDQ